jgi:hypothetical protein
VPGASPVAVVYMVVREQGQEPSFHPYIPCPKPESNCYYTIPDDFSVMVLPYADEELGVLTKEGKRNAFLKLLLTITVIDGVAIALYLILVFGLRWDETTPFILLIVITVITGFYFQWQNQKITNK